jgi:hypothetical protein
MRHLLTPLPAPVKGEMRMADDKREPDWLSKLSEPDAMRNYGPVEGPEEPPQPPPGRASPSPPGGAASQGEGGDTGHSDDLNSGNA